jgi:pyruvate/2-oxoglutarate dehydrogenase complex dihydrolipoamide dehydrogenase (E3) component
MIYIYGAILMKTLIVGMGVIGAIYGWALSEAGVDITQYPDAEPFLKQPPEITTKNYRHTFIETTWGKRALDTGHFKNNPEEMRQFYLEVLETGEKLGVSMPCLSSFKSKILASSSEPG